MVCSCTLIGSFFGIFLILYLINKFIRKLTVDNLQERPVFVTGCDSGFGRSFALKLARRGIPVIAGCLHQEGCDSLKEEVKEFDGHIDTFVVDTGDDESVKNAAKKVEEILGDKSEFFSEFCSVILADS